MTFRTLPVILASLSLSLVACGGGASVSEGKAAVTERKCTGCHTADLGGSTTPLRDTTATYAANLTPDMTTGIGSWTDAQIKTAIRTGVDDEGKELCSKMPRFSDMSDTEVADIVAYLRSLPPVSREIPESTCQ